LWPGH